MKRLGVLSAFVGLLVWLLLESASAGLIPLGGAGTSGGGGGTAAVPTNVILVQQAGTSNSGSPVSNSQKIQWDSMSGATSYNVYRNGTLYASGISATNYTDSAATNSNVLTYDAPATAYLYQVTSVNGAGESALSSDYRVYEYQNGSSNTGQSILNSVPNVSVNWANSGGVTYWGTNALSLIFSGTGDAQPDSNPPLSNAFGLQIGAFKYLYIEAVVSTASNTFLLSLHSRVPNPPGDIFSHISVSTASYVSGGTVIANTLQTYKVPLVAIGLGTTNFHGWISGTTLTVTSIDSTGTQGVDYPGLDRGARLVGLSGTTISAGSYINDMQGSFTGNGGTGTYQLDANNSQTVCSSGAPCAMQTVRDEAYKFDWHDTNGSDPFPITVYMNNFGFSLLQTSVPKFFNLDPMAANDDTEIYAHAA